MNNLIKNLIVLCSLLLLTACGSQFELNSNPTPGLNSHIEDQIGTGEFSVDASQLFKLEDLENLSDEEIIANHIERLKMLLEKLGDLDGILSPEGVEIDKDKLMSDIEARIERLETDEEFAKKVADRIRESIKRIKEMQENGELPTPKEIPTQCEILRKILDSGKLPDAIQEKEEQRYANTCE
jgi:hypothetical protein